MKTFRDKKTLELIQVFSPKLIKRFEEDDNYEELFNLGGNKK